MGKTWIECALVRAYVHPADQDGVRVDDPGLRVRDVHHHKGDLIQADAQRVVCWPA